MTPAVAGLLVVLALGALVVPILAPRLGVPEAVGAIVFGIGAGILGLHPLHEVATVLHLLAELGFILLMFGAGMEIDFEAIERGGRGGVLRGLAVAIGIMLVSFGLTALFGLPAFYGVVLSAVSVGLGVSVLRETGLTTAPVGQALLLVGSLGEFLTLAAMTILGVAAHTGLSASMFWDLISLVAMVAAGAVFLRLLKAWSWWHPGLFSRMFQEHDPSELGVRAALLTCLLFVLLAAVLGVDPVLGAFLAGAVSRVVFRDVRVLEHKMSTLSSGFFVPIFFIFVGLEFDLERLSWAGLRDAAMLGGLLLVARVLPAIGLLGKVDIGPREAAGVALLLGAPLTLLVAIARLGQQLGYIDDAQGSAVVLLAILLSVALPVLFRRLMRGAEG